MMFLASVCAHGRVLMALEWNSSLFCGLVMTGLKLVSQSMP